MHEKAKVQIHNTANTIYSPENGRGRVWQAHYQGSME